MRFIYLLIGLILLSTSLDAEENTHLLTVNGQGRATVKADQATVNLAIQKQGKNALEVQQALAEKLQSVMDVLKKLSLDKLETGTAVINPEYDNSNPPRITGYKGTINIQATMAASKAGDVIDKAFAAGINELNGIALHPTDEAQNEGRLKALQVACQNAMDEAQTVIKALGLEKRNIIKVVVEQGYTPGPLYKGYAADSFVQLRAAPPIEVTNQEQTINATVQVNIEI